MILRLIYNEQLAQASYLVGCSAAGEALIVDPNRDVERYLELAASQELRITAVAETHIHADFVSGSRELAARTGAKLYLSDAGPDEWKYAFAQDAGAILLSDGDSFKVGAVRIAAMHTPGHTPEHISFIVTDSARADRPMGMFSGDFMFVGDVGRPDLLEKATGMTGTTAEGARSLYASVQWFKTLPDYLQVWPGHGAGSACGKSLGAVPQSTVGYERLFNWALNSPSEGEFVRAVVEGQSDPPTYFAQMKKVNQAGPAPLGDSPRALDRLPADKLESELAAGTLVVDARPAEAYAVGHIPGTLNISLGSGFLTWCGWLTPYDQPFGLILDEERAPEALAQLQLIGLDNVLGYWTPDVLDAWAARGRRLGEIERIEAAELKRMLDDDAVAVLDVRREDEYEHGAVAGSLNIPLGKLAGRLSTLPLDRPVMVHCQSGVRSAIAASMLAAAGRTDVKTLVGGYDRWLAAGYPRGSASPSAEDAGKATKVAGVP